jgi:hypothetical protein
MSKRIKFSFSSVNGGKTAVIKAEDIAASSQRIKQEMKPFVIRYRKNETASVKDARKLVLNA